MNPPKPEQPESGLKRQVVYMPSCVTRMMGPALSDPERASVHEKMLSIFDKAGYEVIYPEVRPIQTTPWAPKAYPVVRPMLAPSPHDARLADCLLQGCSLCHPPDMPL